MVPTAEKYNHKNIIFTSSMFQSIIVHNNPHTIAMSSLNCPIATVRDDEIRTNKQQPLSEELGTVAREHSG